MNQVIRDFLQGMVDLEYEDMVINAREAAADVLKYVNREDAYTLFDATTKAFVSADGNCGQDQWQMFKDIFNNNISYDDFFAMTNYGRDKDFLSNLKAAYRVIPDKARTDLIFLGIILTCSDGTINTAEQDLVDYLL